MVAVVCAVNLVSRYKACHPEVFNTYMNIYGELFVNFRLAYLGFTFLTRHCSLK